jgi:hypothetical protein
LGKTQLASEFVQRFGQFFAGGVLWLSFADPAVVSTEVSACGGPGALALHPEFHTLPIADQVQLMQAAWQSPLPLLLVFDNCEDEAPLAQWRPPHGGCRVLVTSRRAWWKAAPGVRALPLGILHCQESMMLLHYYRPDPPADEVDLEAPLEQQRILRLHRLQRRLVQRCPRCAAGPSAADRLQAVLIRAT